MTNEQIKAAIAWLDAQPVPDTDRWLWLPQIGWVRAEDPRAQAYFAPLL